VVSHCTAGPLASDGSATSPPTSSHGCRFKALVRQDYYLAEAIWAGLYISICLIFAQQLVHLYKANLIASGRVFPW